MKKIEGRARTIRELLDSAKYTIDFYQREYAWKERQVRELIDDLTGRFLDFYEPSHARYEVEQYGHYFLGSIVISHKQGRRFIVDGQQRLTSLTLLLIYLHHRQQGVDGQVDISNLIYSEKYGQKSFNLDVADRREIMRRLLEQEDTHVEADSESVQNIASRYQDLAEAFPEEIKGQALPYFVDWLLENTHLVEIEAYSDEDAYTIFETMNDRGLSLSLPEMLKGYILANIRLEQDQREVNDTWKRHMQVFKEMGAEEEVDFFKNWLRARHANTIRPGKRGAENKDYERVGSEFHRWVRDRRAQMGLQDSDDFMRFVLRDLDFYARQTQAIRRAARTVTPGWESIYYNENRGFTLQTQALLAALRPGDTADAVHRKVALVADFLDIWLARRVWNFRTIAYSSVKYTLFTITRELRRRDDDLVSLSEYLLGYLEGQAETFETQATFRLHQQNYRQVRHTLARLTHWVDTQCGLASHFEDLVSLGKARPFEIEHIWADKYKRYASLYSHPHDFAQARNKIGGLLLLQRGLNQSLGASTYAVKRKAYLSKGANLLARSLHPETYNHNPAFQRFLRETGLPFCPHEDFGPQEQAQRQALYTRLAAQVWSVERVRVGDAVADTDAAQDPTEAPRRERNKAFWTQLLAASAACSGLHAGISPRGDSWLDTQRHGQKWAYVLNSDQARIQLHMDHKDRARNKALFDALRQEQGAIEEALGHALTWKRRGDQISSQIAYTLPVPAGREQPERWPALIDAAVGAMERFYAVLGPRVVAHAPQDGA